MRECIWHQYKYRNWKSKILFNIMRIIGLDKGEVWTSIFTIEGKGIADYGVDDFIEKYTIEINKSDMGRTELLIIKESQ